MRKSARKPRIDPVRWRPPPVDELPEFPPAELTVVPLAGNAPEDVVADAQGNIWTGVDDGRIIRIPADGAMSRLREEQKTAMSRLREEQKTAMSRLREEQKTAMSRLREEQKTAMSRLREEQKTAMSRLREEQKTAMSRGHGRPTVVGNTGGRPLGLAIARDGRLLICDSPRGLLAMDTSTGRSEPLVETVAGRHLTFCSNVVESSSGTIYFTESTSAFTYPHAMGAFFEARGRGSLFRRAPDGVVTTLLDGLYFANGVTLTADESALVFAETLGRRLSKYWLTGPQAGLVTPLAVNLPGAPDNLSTGADGRIWCAMVAPVDAAGERFMPRAPVLRKLLWHLPDRLHRLTIKSEVWVIAVDPDTGDVIAGFRTDHPAFGLVTGLVEAEGRLWMGCIGNSAVAYIVL